MPANQKPHHFLVEPRLVAAVGLVALGAGLGVGLMLARTLIYAGFLIALCSAAGVIWIYLAHFMSAYRALVKGRKYKGPSIKELLVAIGMVLVLIPVAASVFAIALRDEAVVHRGVLTFGGPSPLLVPGTDRNIVNITLSNTGDLPIVSPATAIGGWLRETLASADEITREVARLKDQLKKRDQPGPHRNSIQKGAGTVVTIPDLQISTVDWSKISEGKAYLYVFAFANYSDEAIEGKGYWKMELCAWFTVTFAYWHNCIENKVEFVKGNRYQ